MPSRRSLILAALPIFLFPALSHAAEAVPFTAEHFAAAQNAGKPILIDIAASWCPTCKAQAPIIEELTSRDDYKDIVVFHVDFDEQIDVVRSFNARMQSTLIVFKGHDEVARSVGETDPAAIEQLLSKATAGS